MKQLIGIFLFINLVFSTEVKADNLYLARTQANMDFENYEVNPNGFSLGYQWEMEKARPYFEFQMVSDDEKLFKYKGLNIGTKLFFVTKSKFTFGFDIEGGYGWAEIENARNDFRFGSIGAGAFITFDITDTIGLFVNGKYIHYMEITQNTKCKDNTFSDSMGRGTCSHHKGVAFYQHKLGNGNGLKLNFGLKVSF